MIGHVVCDKNFNKTYRGFEKPPVWIFITNGLDISILVDNLKELTIIDINNCGDVIRADIIIVDSIRDLDIIDPSIVNYLPIMVDFQYRPSFKVSEKKTFVFYGRSGIGKSFIGSKVNSDIISVAETDSFDGLPNEPIIEDILVLGNRHKWTLELLADYVDNDIISVYFND